MKLEDMTEPQLRGLMSSLADAVQQTLRRLAIESADGGRNQFVLVLFDDPKVAQYVATCERKSMIEAMRETAARLEGREDVPR